MSAHVFWALAVALSVGSDSALATPHDPARVGPAGGLLLGPSGAPTYFAPLWVTAAGYVIAQTPLRWSPDAAPTPGPLACWDVSGPSAVALEPALTEAAYLATSDSGVMYAFDTGPTVSEGGRVIVDGNNLIRVWRVACGEAPVLLGDLPVPAPTPGQTVSWPQLRRVPIASDGSFLVPRASGLVRVEPDLMRATLLLSGAAIHAALGAGPAHIDVNGIAVVPDTHGGGTYLSFDRRVDLAVTGLVTRLEPSGLRVLRDFPGRLGTGPGLVWDGTLAALVSPPVIARLGHGVHASLLPLVALDGAGEVIGEGTPWPYAQDLNDAGAPTGSDVAGIIAGAEGRARVMHCWAAYPEAECRVGLLGFDAAHADLDRDGVSHARELALGLDDRDPDGDGDGASDAVELHFGFDPRDPTEPARSDADTVLAPSSIPGDWVGDFSSAYRERDHGVALCEPVEGQEIAVNPVLTCLDPAGDTLPLGTFPVRPAFTPDAQVAFYQTPTRFGRERTDVGLRKRRAGSTSDEPVFDEAAVVDWAGLSFDATTMHVLGPDLFYHQWSDRLTRFQGGQPHVVIDLARTDCPIAATAADVARCGADDLRMAGPIGWHVVAVDAARQELLVFVSAGPRRQVLAIGTDSVSVAFDVSALPGALEPQRLIALPAGTLGEAPAWLVPLNRNDPAPPYRGYRGGAVLDAGLRVRSAAQPPVEGVPSAWFHDGLLDVRVQPFWVFPTTGPCAEGFFDTCGDGNQSKDPYQVYAPDPTAWVATPVGLGAGDTLLFSGRYGVEEWQFSGWVDQGGALVPTPFRLDDLGWVLWRVADGGGTLPWLDRATFERLAGAALVGAVGPITHLAVRPDARRVCLVEGGADRAWDIAVDANGTPESVRAITGPAGLSACGYAADGAIAVLGRDTLRIGSDDHAVDGGPDAELVRVGERWLIAPSDANATCLGGGDTGIRMVAVAAIDDVGAAWVDSDGGAYAGPIDAVCAGAGATEVMLDGHLWKQSTALFWSYTGPATELVATGGAITVRADGAVIYTTAGIEGPYHDDMLYHMRPTWRPLDWADRLTSLDAVRREAPRMRAQSLELRRVTAMATVPGGTTSASSWSYFARTPPPPLTAPEAGGETEDVELGPEARPAANEGCAGGPSATVLLGVLAIALTTRRSRALA